MVRQALVVRGGALGRDTGLGAAHAGVVRLLASGEIEGWTLAGEVEHREGGIAPWRLMRRWWRHPKRVRRALRSRAKDDASTVMLVSDQEHAHLVPKRRIRGLRTAVVVHDLFALAPRTIELSDGVMKEFDERIGPVRWLDLRRLRRGLRRADLLICVSEATRQRCAEVFPQVDTVHVPSGVNLSRYAPNEPDVHGPPGGCALLVVGNDHARKRMDFLARVLTACPEEVRADLHLIRVGGGQTDAGRRALRTAMEWADVRLTLHDRIEEEELQALRLRCEALLFPSVAEGYGYPPVEAMAAGLPVLASDMPNHGSMVHPSCLLPVDDVEAWVDRICDLHATWTLRTEAGTHWEPRVPDEVLMAHAALYSTEAQAAELKRALDGLLQGEPGR